MRKHFFMLVHADGVFDLRTKEAVERMASPAPQINVHERLGDGAWRHPVVMPGRAQTLLLNSFLPLGIPLIYLFFPDSLYPFALN